MSCHKLPSLVSDLKSLSLSPGSSRITSLKIRRVWDRRPPEHLLWLLERTNLAHLALDADIFSDAEDWRQIGKSMAGTFITSLTLDCEKIWQLDEAVSLAPTVRRTLKSLSVSSPRLHLSGSEANSTILAPPPHHSSALIPSPHPDRHLEIKALTLDHWSLYGLSDIVGVQNNADSRSRIALSDQALPQLEDLSLSVFSNATSGHQKRGVAFLLQQHAHKIRFLDLGDMSASAPFLPSGLDQLFHRLERLAIASFGPTYLSLMPTNTHELLIRQCEPYAAHLLAGCLLADRVQNALPRLQMITVDNWSDSPWQAVPETALVEIQKSLAELGAPETPGDTGSVRQSAWLKVLDRACACKGIKLQV